MLRHIDTTRFFKSMHDFVRFSRYGGVNESSRKRDKNDYGQSLGSQKMGHFFLHQTSIVGCFSTF